MDGVLASTTRGPGQAAVSGSLKFTCFLQKLLQTQQRTLGKAKYNLDRASKEMGARGTLVRLREGGRERAEKRTKREVGLF